MRKRAGYTRAFCTEIVEALVASLTTELRQRAKRQLDLASVNEAHTGLVTFVPRSDGALRRNVHLHTLALDGVYVRNADGKLGLHALAPPDEGGGMCSGEADARAPRATLREAWVER